MTTKNEAPRDHTLTQRRSKSDRTPGSQTQMGITQLEGAGDLENWGGDQNQETGFGAPVNQQQFLEQKYGGGNFFGDTKL